MNHEPLPAQGPVDVNVRALAWVRRHKNDDPNDWHLYVDTSKDEADRWLSQFKHGYAWLEPLYPEAAIREEREACARILELRDSELLLMAGEMTAQELRTVKAVLAQLARDIRERSNEQN